MPCSHPAQRKTARDVVADEPDHQRTRDDREHTGGGPGNSTTFVSIELVKIALGQFDLGKAAALSLVYNLIIIIVCWIFYTVMTNAGVERRVVVDKKGVK